MLGSLTGAVLDRLGQPAAEQVAEWERRDRQHAASERANRIATLESELRIDLGAKLAQARIVNYEIYDDRQREVIDRIKAIVPQLPQLVADGRGLAWAGRSGTGKDFMAAAVGMAAVKLHAIPVRRIDARSLAVASPQRAEAMIDEFRHARVLLVSDPSPTTPTQIDRLFALMSNREDNGRPTWLTVNGGSRDEIGRLLGPALLGRFLSNSETFLCEWDDYRLREKK